MIDPITRFGRLLERAMRADLPEPTATALATASPDGQPSVRMVLLKGFDESGFVFYTNMESRKARELAENPWAALCFYWHPLAAQVRIEGNVRPVTDEEADVYFSSRPRGSQIGAWVSLQSQPLGSYAELDTRFDEITARFEGGPVPRPAFWSGLRLIPERIEFWSGKPNRLHQREAYTRDPVSGDWQVQLLYP